MTLTSCTRQVDVREIAPRDRHSLIFSTFHGLGVNETLELINDHNPKPLYYQFLNELEGQFRWDYLQGGPEVWRVRILKTGKSPAKKGLCCGMCGGAAS
jgi:uncharacterized protein (DUF2249 family)